MNLDTLRLRRQALRFLGFSVTLLVVAHAAWAESAPRQTPARAEPLDASAPVPPAIHRSVLGAYRAERPAEVGSWSQANETVNRIGGWRTYAREAAPAAATPPSAPAPAPASPPAPAPAVAPAHRHH